MNGTSFASGNWVVKAGREDEFVARWSEFLDWTGAEAKGFRWATLVRDTEDPRHFISFAEWEGVERAEAWRRLPGFRQRLAACRELCDEFRGADYDVAARIGGYLPLENSAP